MTPGGAQTRVQEPAEASKGASPRATEQKGNPMTHDPRDVECAREAMRLTYDLDHPANAAILAAKLARERAEAGGVCAKTLRAREIIAVEAERRSDRWLAAMYRTGAADDTLSLCAVLAALSEGERG